MSVFKRLLYLILLVFAASCIDPYIPSLKNYKSLLVVEGLITNENRAYNIKLSRTFTQADSLPEKVTDADVYITDGEGIKTTLQNCGSGIYKTDSTQFIGKVGQKYVLHILTGDSKEYISDECPMFPVADIDSIYYEKNEEVLGDPSKSYIGLEILLNTEDITGSDQYLRWAFEEVWKTVIPYPPEFTFTPVNDTTYYFQSVPVQNHNCWKRSLSSDIIINSISSGGHNHINGQKIQFIPPQISDRLSLEYSILVKQYSISEKEYSFWRMLKQVGEPKIDIFGTQPYPTASNIHNLNNSNEMVLGYFEVSAVMEKRMFLKSDELKPLNLPANQSKCEYISLSPDDWHIPPKPSWVDIYHSWVDIQHYRFVRPLVSGNAILPGAVTNMNLIKFVFTSDGCAFCEKPGTSVKPDFWIDR
jgi:hypothetical protein